MTKIVSASSQLEKQRRAKKPSIVTTIPDPNRKATPEELDALQRIADMPDELIRTDLIPELPPEAWKRAIKNPWARLLREQAARKAS